jgi:hypothetical protein
MTGYFDPLSLAVGVVSAFYTWHDNLTPGWAEADIYRLLSGGGWLVNVTVSSIILDPEMSEVAA